jgi:hypothetical protein
MNPVRPPSPSVAAAILTAWVSDGTARRPQDAQLAALAE